MIRLALLLMTMALVAPALASRAQAHHGAYGPVGCEGAPSDAVLNAPEPVGSWLVVYCSDSGHILAPIPGDVWLLVRDNRAYVVTASDEAEDEGHHGVYFAGMTTRSIVGDEFDAAVARLVSELDTDRTIEPDSVQLLTLRNNRGREREIYFFSKGGEPVLALVCFGSCDDTVIFHIDHAIVD